MSDDRTFSRRLALAGLGASALGLAIASPASAGPPILPNADMGAMGGGSESLAGHPLSGLWLAMIDLPSRPGVVQAVPSVFSPDGFVVLMFPVAESRSDGVRLKGAAVGTWAPVSDRGGHFTIVQALCDGSGEYQGTVTIDGFPVVRDGLDSFEDASPESGQTVRDASNAVVSVEKGYARIPLVAYRMSPGNPGFRDQQENPSVPGPQWPPDPRTPL